MTRRALNLAAWQGGPRTKASGAEAEDARPRIGRRRLRLLWAVAIVGVAVYLYYRPIASYLETRNDLATSRAEVESLRLVKAELELRLVNSTSVDSIEREARRIGYVQAGRAALRREGHPGLAQGAQLGATTRP